MTFCRFILIAFAIILYQNQIVGQLGNVVESDFGYVTNNPKIIDQLEQKSSSFLNNLKSRVKQSDYKLIKRELGEFESNFRKEIEEGKYLNRGRHIDYLIKLLRHVTESNNLELSNYLILIAKSNSPNAYCLPTGVFIFNLGLFYWLPQEAQIASVLCHELAHNLLDHVVKAQIAQYKENAKSKTTTRKLGLSSKKVRELYKRMIYSKSSLSRQFELEADSLGCVLIKRSNYPAESTLRALSSLMNYDSITSNSSLDFSKVLDFFKNAGVDVDTNLTQNSSHLNSYIEDDGVILDSILDHPDVLLRISKLKETFSLNVYPQAFLGDTMTQILGSEAESLFAEILFNEDKLGDCFYHCFLNLRQTNEDDYSRKWLSKCFRQMKASKTTYTLSKVLDGVNIKRQKYDFAMMLHILWSLSLSDIDKVSNHLM